MASSQRHRERLTIGSGAILTAEETAQLLPLADKAARDWLRDQGLVRYMAGRPVVVWADVQATLAVKPAEEPQCAPTSRLRRKKLGGAA